ncbi:MAG: ATP synthase subunit I [Pseudomonadota bacterium]
MPDALSWTLAALAGLLLGAIFFGGLWWTVQRGLTSPRPALWFFASLLLRMGIAMAGFYWVVHTIGASTWQPLLLCLLGFVLARPLVLRLTRQPTNSSTEACHAA